MNDETTLAELVGRIDRGPVADRLAAVAAIGRLGAAAEPAIPALVAAFADRTMTRGGSTGYGPTGHDPGRDFVVALAAVDAVAAIGAAAAPAVRAVLEHAKSWDPRRYHAALAAGRLADAAAVPALVAAIHAFDTVSVRVNFDQEEEYPLHEAALRGLVCIDPARAWASLDEVVRTRGRGRRWALEVLAATPEAGATVRALLADDVLRPEERAAVERVVGEPAAG